MRTCIISDDDNFDHLVKVVSAGSSVIITISPFVIKRHLLGVDN